MSARSGIAAIIDLTPAPVAALFRSDRLMTRAVRRLVNHCLPRDPTEVIVRSGAAAGLRLLIFPRQEKYYWTGNHERMVQETMVSILRPGMTFWDVGAHIGFFSLLASRRVGDSGHVHAFEPMEANRNRLIASIEANGFGNVEVHECAVADRAGEGFLRAHESSLMWALGAGGGEEPGSRVRCRTLDQLAGLISRPDLIKVDAEGAEVEVLRGGLGLFSTVRPALVVEFSSSELVNQARELLPSYGFKWLAGPHWLLFPRRSKR